MRSNDDGKTVGAFDILAPDIGEIVGGSQREERIEVLESKIDEVKESKLGFQTDLEIIRRPFQMAL